MKTRSKPVAAAWERILLVDDDPDVAALVSLSLGRFPGCAVEVCLSSLEAVDRARSFQPHLVLLDVMMPVMDGPATLLALRADPATAAIPVIFISAGVDRNDAPRCEGLGVAGIIPKPFDPVLLPSTLAEICRGERVKPAFPKALAGVGGEYLADLREKVDAMTALAAGLVASGWRQAPARSLLETAHRIAGSSGLYGMADLSRAAAILEAHLKRALEGPRWPPSRPPDDVATLVKALARHLPRSRRARRPRQVPAAR